MSEVDGRSYTPDGPTVASVEDAKKASFRGPKRGAPAQRSARKKLALKVLPWVLGILIVGALIGYFATSTPKTGQTRAGTFGTSDSSSGGGTLAKPAAGKPLVQAPPAPPPVVVPRSAPPAIPQSSSGLVIPPGPAIPAQSPVTAAPQAATGTPPAPVTAGNAPFAPVVYSARHDKIFGGGCSGQLTLNSSGLYFNCPDDPHGSVQAEINEIDSVDENGVRLTSGKKYHFSISGMSKGGVEQMFRDWFSRVR
jgi:hypothetical protein